MNVGDKVYYVENGPDDTGRVVSTSTENHRDRTVVWYTVQWDDEESTRDQYTLSQLAPVPKVGVSA